MNPDLKNPIKIIRQNGHMTGTTRPTLHCCLCLIFIFVSFACRILLAQSSTTDSLNFLLLRVQATRFPYVSREEKLVRSPTSSSREFFYHAFISVTPRRKNAMLMVTLAQGM